MRKDHYHGSATPSKDADRLEVEIEAIEQSIIDLTRELLYRLRNGYMRKISHSKVILTFGVIIILRLTGSLFSKRARLKRNISKLKKQNTKLLNQNRKLRCDLNRYSKHSI